MFATLRVFSLLVGFNPQGADAADAKASPVDQCDPDKLRTVHGKTLCADGHQEGRWTPDTWVISEPFENTIGTSTRYIRHLPVELSEFILNF
jgi:hypothetical protein